MQCRDYGVILALLRSIHAFSFPYFDIKELVISPLGRMTKLTDINYNADMPKEMIEQARTLVIEAFETYSVENQVATHVKREFTKKHNGLWHCIVGKDFGSYVTHEMKGYIYITWGQMNVLMWKTVS